MASNSVSTGGWCRGPSKGIKRGIARGTKQGVNQGIKRGTKQGINAETRTGSGVQYGTQFGTLLRDSMGDVQDSLRGPEPDAGLNGGAVIS